MNILFVNRYFWPETVLLNDISGWAADAGFNVKVITSRPSHHPGRYPRKSLRGAANVLRLPLLPQRRHGLLRRVNDGLFMIQAAIAVAFSRKVDVVWCTTIPPVLQGWLVLAASRLRGARFVYFVQDIHPELAQVSGVIRSPLLTWALKAIDSHTISLADRVVALSGDMAASLKARGISVDPEIINNFTSGRPMRTASGKARGTPLRLIFAGNIGQFQNLEQLVDLVLASSPDDVTLDLMGEGMVKDALMDIVAASGSKNVRFLPAVGGQAALDAMVDYDAGIVSLAPHVARYAYPSKTFSYLAAGLPILAMVEEDSSVAEDLTRYGVGVTCGTAPTLERFAAAIAQLRSMPASVDVAARSEALHHPEHARSKWLALFEGLAAGDRAAASEGVARP